MASTTGTIKRKTDKGFGFMVAADGTEYFFHQLGCVGTRFDDLREDSACRSPLAKAPKVRERRTSSRNSVEWPPAAAP
jgi:cold shock protein